MPYVDTTVRWIRSGGSGVLYTDLFVHLWAGYKKFFLFSQLIIREKHTIYFLFVSLITLLCEFIFNSHHILCAHLQNYSFGMRHSEVFFSTETRSYDASVNGLIVSGIYIYIYMPFQGS